MSVMHSLKSLMIVIILFGCTSIQAQTPLTQRAEFKRFVDRMVNEHQFNAKLLQKLFKKVELKESIIEAITRPAEAKPWYQYRPIFMTDQRIRGGVEFWNKHRSTLARAEQTYGVPAEIIIAIVGVETRYGTYMGNYRVIDALATLAFDYPARSTFFTKELEEYLLMTREEQVDPLKLKGSYAGAMGQPQFISSSFRSYAVDFDKDGQRDLWTNTTDVIGSVANYFKRHGWKKGMPIAAPAISVKGKRHKNLLEKGIKPQVKLSEFKRFGVEYPSELNRNQEASLFALENEDSAEYWIGLKNFYVITRYNHSALYAMAVYQLSREIKQGYVQQNQTQNHVTTKSVSEKI